VSEKAKLIRGDPPKIALKRRGSPLKKCLKSSNPSRKRKIMKKINISI
jgi:hypothetical protein